MKLSLAEPTYLKESISIISDLVSEARFKVTPDAIELVAMDPANVAMVVFKLLSSSFTEYNVQKEQNLAINLSNFKQILRRAKPEDILTLELEENKLKIQLKSNTTRTFSLPIIDLEEKEQKVPELKFPVNIKTTAALLNDTIEDVDIVAESVTFQTEPKKFIVLAEGDLSQAKIEVPEGEDTKITAGSDTVKSKYSIEYLKKMINASKLANEVTLQFDKDYPLKLEYTVVDKLQLAFILAPRVENE
ncbi:proliferating cell nuclear antigen (pcna) [Candidatus Woesearchaeota archaeon]|nr:proliferating cell nuclear antigen (pcna) [Candidatus Woesearchaeota archaeon]|tara:strand:- start:13274 stop:14014 length:741 start_codon:yes stop_codon:yes gene_type:complete